MNWRDYYYLAKPGIIYGNALATVGGFFLAEHGRFDPWLFLATLIGISLVIGSACAANNYLDRHIDRQMDRTRHRAVAAGRITDRAAISFSAITGLLGAGLLALYTNPLTLLAAVSGWVLYVWVYGYFKRRSPRGTEVGSLSGAVPPVVGYVAVTGRLDGGAWLLFLLLVLWQMPHFYAIAQFRLTDYRAANIPVLAAVAPPAVVRRFAAAYIFAFLAANPLLTLLHYTGYTYLVIMSLTGLGWLYLALRPVNPDPAAWARRLFRASLLVLVIMCFMWSVNVLLP